MPLLILTRHGESEFNAKHLWTGTADVPLTPKGRRDAEAIAQHVRDLPVEMAFTSKLQRARNTLAIILRSKGLQSVPVHESTALNEQDYGELTGQSSRAIEDRYGLEQLNRWRRGWDEAAPGGEPFVKVYERVSHYYAQAIKPELLDGKNVLIVSHGNALRALRRNLDNSFSSYEATSEMVRGEIIVYQLDDRAEPINRDFRHSAKS